MMDMQATQFNQMHSLSLLQATEVGYSSVNREVTVQSTDVGKTGQPAAAPCMRLRSYIRIAPVAGK